MRVRLLCLIAVGAATIALAACSANSAAPTPPTLVFAPVPAPGGGAPLTNGDSVTVPAGVLAGANVVAISTDAAETPVIPLPGWKAAHGTMTVKFPGGIGASTTGASIGLTFAFAADVAARVLAAQAPVLEVTTAKGAIERVTLDATFNAANNTLTANVPVAFVTGATAIKIYAAVDGSGITPEAFGPRLWSTATTPAQWIPQPFTVNPNASTVVMVHGIFSSVETAFGPCEGNIIGAGGYGQAVGLDYDWTQPPATEAPILANFINSLPVSTVDIEAHSYGTVVALAAMPLITKKIGHVVLLGGPLPLNGSPQADPGYLRDLVMLGVWIAYPSDVYRADHSGMIAAMATNSATMKAIDSGVRGLSNLPPFVQVAGQHALPQELENDFTYALYQSLYGFTNNDGVVEEQSAVTKFPTTTSFVDLSLDHIQLECDSGVISWVGSQVDP